MSAVRCHAVEAFPAGEKLARLEADPFASQRWARELSDRQLAAVVDDLSHPLRADAVDEQLERDQARAADFEERRNNGELDDSPCLERPWWESP